MFTSTLSYFDVSLGVNVTVLFPLSATFVIAGVPFHEKLPATESAPNVALPVILLAGTGFPSYITVIGFTVTTGISFDVISSGF